MNKLSRAMENKTNNNNSTNATTKSKQTKNTHGEHTELIDGRHCKNAHTPMAWWRPWLIPSPTSPWGQQLENSLGVDCIPFMEMNNKTITNVNNTLKQKETTQLDIHLCLFHLNTQNKCDAFFCSSIVGP